MLLVPRPWRRLAGGGGVGVAVTHGGCVVFNNLLQGKSWFEQSVLSFPGQFSAHHLVYFWMAMKIQWGSNFLEKIPLLLIKIYFWPPDRPVLSSPQIPHSQRASPVSPPRGPSLLRGSALWQKHNQRHRYDSPSYWRGEAHCVSVSRLPPSSFFPSFFSFFPLETDNAEDRSMFSWPLRKETRHQGNNEARAYSPRSMSPWKAFWSTFREVGGSVRSQGNFTKCLTLRRKASS